MNKELSKYAGFQASLPRSITIVFRAWLVKMDRNLQSSYQESSTLTMTSDVPRGLLYMTKFAVLLRHLHVVCDVKRNAIV